MTDQKAQPAQAPAFRTNRVEAFSDGVFAIAITLLVLEIAVPVGSERDLWAAVVDEWPSYLAYLVSFSTVGAVWVAHTIITECLVRATPVLIRLNLLLLMVVSFLPFPTKLLAEYVGEDRPERIAATIYGLNLLLTAVLVSAVWRYAVREGLIRPDIADEYVKLITWRLTPGLVGYAVMIMLGLFLPLAAVLGYLIIAVYNLIPFRGVRRRGRRPTRAATETPLLSVALPDTGSPSGVTLIQPPNATLQLTDRQGGLTYFRSSLVPWTVAISGFTPDG